MASSTRPSAVLIEKSVPRTRRRTASRHSEADLNEYPRSSMITATLLPSFTKNVARFSSCANPDKAIKGSGGSVTITPRPHPVHVRDVLGWIGLRWKKTKKPEEKMKEMKGNADPPTTRGPADPLANVPAFSWRDYGVLTKINLFITQVAACKNPKVCFYCDSVHFL